MKKIIQFIALVALMTVALTSCLIPGHDHTFAEEWTTDSDYHWHACTAMEGCIEKDAKEAHDYEVLVNEDEELVNVCKVCGYENKKVSTAPEHEHVWGDTYTTSENFHWHECTVEGCYEADKSDEHQYGNPETTYEDQKLTIKYTCVDCEYVKTEVKNVDTAVDDAVEWDNIFENFKLTNFSMYVYLGGKANPEQVNHCIVTEEGVYYCIPDSREFYVVKNGDGSYEAYQRSDSSDSFSVMPEEMREAYFDNATRETVIQVTFAENFEKFVYDEQTGTYYAEEMIEAICYDFSGEDSETLYCYNSEVKLIDGKISSIACDYSFDSSDDDLHSFIYFNIGISEVKIPQAVVDGAVIPPKYDDEEDNNVESGGNLPESEAYIPSGTYVGETDGEVIMFNGDMMAVAKCRKKPTIWFINTVSTTAARR